MSFAVISVGAVASLLPLPSRGSATGVTSCRVKADPNADSAHAITAGLTAARWPRALRTPNVTAQTAEARASQPAGLRAGLRSRFTAGPFTSGTGRADRRGWRAAWALR